MDGVSERVCNPCYPSSASKTGTSSGKIDSYGAALPDCKVQTIRRKYLCHILQELCDVWRRELEIWTPARWWWGGHGETGVSREVVVQRRYMTSDLPVLVLVSCAPIVSKVGI